MRAAGKGGGVEALYYSGRVVWEGNPAEMASEQSEPHAGVKMSLATIQVCTAEEHRTQGESASVEISFFFFFLLGKIRIRHQSFSLSKTFQEQPWLIWLGWLEHHPIIERLPV